MSTPSISFFRACIAYLEFITSYSPAHPPWANDSIATLLPRTSILEQPTSKSSKPLVAAIAGGTVGGVVLFAAAVGAAWFCSVKRKRVAEEPPPSYVPELHDKQSYPELGTERTPEMEAGYISTTSQVTSSRDQFSELP